MNTINQNNQSLPNNDFLHTQVDKKLLLITSASSLVYFMFLIIWFPKGQPILWALLIASEIFHLWQTFTFIYTVWRTDYQRPFDRTFLPPVDVFITVAGEDSGTVEQTIMGALAMDYPNFQVHILNDGYVAKKNNWKEIILLAEKLGVNCITRKIPGGAKAGNINFALARTEAPFVAVFDADHIPHENFLKKTVGFFADPLTAFVQTPQYYKNFAANEVSRGAWEQQELFFGPILRGKNRLNAAFMCGTNMVIRKNVLLAVGGMAENNIAEDFLTSLFIHSQGWNSVYVPEILSEGLAPEDMTSYYKQQFRWSRGSLEIIFKHNPLFYKKLSFAQKIQYLTSSSYYLSGAVIVINALLPLIFFYTGLIPVRISTMLLAVVFLPYIFLNVLTLRLASNFAYTFRALSFSMSSFGIQLQALGAVLTGRKSEFVVTSKKRLNTNDVWVATPHLIYLILLAVGLEVAIWREGLSAAVIANFSWALFNAVVFMPFLTAALPSFKFKNSEQKTLPIEINSNDLSRLHSINK